MPIQPRAAAALLAAALRAIRVVVVTGPRQAGKSTFVEYHPALATRRYWSLDDAAVRARVADDPLAFVRSEPSMTIDEVQRAPDLILAIKSLVDRQRPKIPGQFVLTGSANLLMMKRIGDSLAGRASYLTLWPMSRREQLGEGRTGAWQRFFGAPTERWLELVRTDPAPPADWREYAARGGFPELALAGPGLSAGDRALWFDGYVTSYLERDLRDLAAVTALGDFQRLMRAAALRIGNLVNQAELGRDVGLTAMTVHRYLNLLESSYQVVRLEAYAINRSKRLIKSPKLYWSDPGLALHLAGGGNVGPTGAHFENLVLCDLLAWRESQAPKPSISYWRTASGHEVDFVIEHGRHLLGVEVKSGAQPRLRDIPGLQALLADYGHSAIGGLVLHGGSESYWLAERILAAPWWAVL